MTPLSRPTGLIVTISLLVMGLRGLLEMPDHLRGVGHGELIEIGTVGLQGELFQFLLVQAPPFSQVHDGSVLGLGHLGRER